MGSAVRYPGQNKKLAWVCGKTISKTRLWPWQKRWNAWQIPTRVGFWFHSVSLLVLVVAMWEGAYWEGVWLCLDPWGVVRLRTSSSSWNDLREYGPHSELFFFLIRKEPVALTQAVPFESFVCAETLKAWALIGLHLLAAKGEAGSSGSQSPDSADMWRYGCPESTRDSDVESWTESEGASSSEQCQHNVESVALNVLGQDQSSEEISLFLEDWELARVTLSCRIALDVLCQEMPEPW